MKTSMRRIASLMPRRSMLAMIGTTILLAACGGGGGGGGGDNGGGGTGTGVITPPPRTAQKAYFVARDPNLEQDHIYAGSDEDGSMTQLTPNSTVTNARITRMAMSPDGTTIAYAATHDTPSVLDLYLLPTTGETPTKVTTTMPAGVSIREIAWSPDSSQLAYVANPLGRAPRGFEINEVFMVDRDGNNNRKINGSIGSPPKVRVDSVKWSPDGRLLAQMVSILDPFLGRIGINIYDTTLGHPNSVRITEAVNTANFETLGFHYEWHPDSSKLAYLSEHESGNREELFVASAVGLLGIDKLNGPLVTNGQVSTFSWSPSGDYILYTATQDDVRLSGHYVSNEDGSNNRRLDNPATDTTRAYGGTSWAPDDDRIVFAAAQNIADVPEIFVTDMTGNVTRINPPLVDGQFASGAMWSPDGNSVAFLSNMDASGNNALFVGDASGAGAPVQISGATTWQAFFGARVWSPDSSHLAYSMNHDDQGTQDLYIGDTRGQSQTRVNSALTPPEKISFRTPVWSRDGTRILFQTEDDNYTPIDLSVGHDDGAPALQLNQTHEFRGTAIY